MAAKVDYPVLSADLQVGFHYRLRAIKDLYFNEALSKTIKMSGLLISIMNLTCLCQKKLYRN